MTEINKVVLLLFMTSFTLIVYCIMAIIIDFIIKMNNLHSAYLTTRMFKNLYAKYLEYKHPQRILEDELAYKMVKQSNIDATVRKCEQLKTVVKAKYFDDQVQDFILKNDQVVVVNLVCGLDSRYWRIKDKKSAIFYELDSADVIELRKQYFSAEQQGQLIVASLFETKWMDEMLTKHPNSSFVFVLEDVLSYVEEQQVKQLLINLAERFHHSIILFDAVSSWVASDKEIKFSVSFPSEICLWAANIQHLDTTYATDISSSRWGCLGFLQRAIPVLHRSKKMLTYGFV